MASNYKIYTKVKTKYTEIKSPNIIYIIKGIQESHNKE